MLARRRAKRAGVMGGSGEGLGGEAAAEFGDGGKDGVDAFVEFGGAVFAGFDDFHFVGLDFGPEAVGAFFEFADALGELFVGGVELGVGRLGGLAAQAFAEVKEVFEDGHEGGEADDPVGEGFGEVNSMAAEG